MTARSELIRTIAASSGLPVPRVAAYARAINPGSPWTSKNAARLLLAIVAAETPAMARTQTRRVGAFGRLRAVAVSRDGADYADADPALFGCFAGPLVDLLAAVIDELRRGETDRPVAVIERLAVTDLEDGGVLAQIEGVAGRARVVLDYTDAGTPAEDLAATSGRATRSIPGAVLYAAAEALGTSPAATVH